MAIGCYARWKSNGVFLFPEEAVWDIQLPIALPTFVIGVSPDHVGLI